MNLNEEIRNGYTISASMKEAWNIQMIMLQKLLDVCKQHDLKIWADSGTLLGAVRHKGYIPWDDDIDMVMPREDYNKLVSIAQQEFSDPFFFQNPYTDKYHCCGHSQLRYNGTAEIFPAEINARHHQGIFIDIFVFDELPKDKNELAKNLLKAESIREFLYLSAHGLEKVKIDGKFKITLFVKWIMARVYTKMFGRKKMYAEFEHLYSCYQSAPSGIIGMPTIYLANILKYKVHKSWYDETIMLPFEDMMIPAPKDYDKVLTEYYGDYMKPVKAPTLHGEVIIDAHRSYKDVIKDIKRKGNA